MKKLSFKNKIDYLFLAYVIIMSVLLFCRPFYIYGNYIETLKKLFCIDPFNTISGYIYAYRKNNDFYAFIRMFINVAGNVFMFIPLGMIIPHFLKPARNIFVFLPLAVICDVFIELRQLFLAVGVCDIDDILLNVPGICIGYLLYMICILVRRLLNFS